MALLTALPAVCTTSTALTPASLAFSCLLPGLLEPLPEPDFCPFLDLRPDPDPLVRGLEVCSSLRCLEDISVVQFEPSYAKTCR
jgi:hypothetical protein